MTILLYESPDGPSIKKDSAEYRYTVEGTESELWARLTLINGTPSAVTVSGITLVRKDAQVELGEGPDVWSGLVTYGEKDRPETGESTYQFDTGGGTQHITHSIKTVGKYAPAGKTPPDCQGAIGWDGQSVAGVDIHVPIFHFAETHFLPVSIVTESYKHLVHLLTGRVADAPFRGKAIGEVLFCGAGGSQRGAEDWGLTFKFAGSPNKTGIEVGKITVAAKKGWEYLWIRYRPKDDAVAQDVVPDPIAAYVEQVYEYADFSQLGLGG